MREVQKKSFRRQCKICHKKSFWVSRNGLCIDCVKNRVKAANIQIKTKEGPVYEKWKERVIRSLDKLA